MIDLRPFDVVAEPAAPAGAVFESVDSGADVFKVFATGPGVGRRNASRNGNSGSPVDLAARTPPLVPEAQNLVADISRAGPAVHGV